MHILFAVTDGFVDVARTLFFFLCMVSQEGLPALYGGRSDEKHLYKIPLFKAAV